MGYSKIICLALTFAALAILPSSPLVAQETGKIALVYDGKFASGSRDFENVLVANGHEVKYFSDVNELQTKLASASLLLFPGTDDDAGSLDAFVKEFRPATLLAIKDFVRNGGNYIGVCGGAYIVSTSYSTAFDSGVGLGLAPVMTEGYLESDSATILDINWKGKTRTIYYQLGPRFMAETSVNAKTVATYPDGTIAAIMIGIGEGKFYLLGPHPEVLAENLEPSDVPDGTLRRLTDTSDLLTDMMNDLKGK